MPQSQISRMVRTAALGAAMAITGAAAPSVLTAQAKPNQKPGATGYGAGNTTAATQPMTSSNDMNDDRDNDRDWGWIGLLGLAGLLGLRRRDHVHHVDHVDTTTTRRPVT